MKQVVEPSIEPEDAERAARAVLSDRKYLEAARPPSLRERFFDWVGEQITDLLAALSSGGGRGVIAWVIVGVFVAVIGFLLFRLLAQVDPVRKVKESPEIDVAVFANRTAAEWRAAADDAERVGDWREGLRCRHRALVAELLDRGLVDSRPGRTAAEIARLAGDRVPEAHDPLQRATRLFEDVWYGWRSADATTRDEFVEHARAAQRAADEFAAADDGLPRELVGA